MAYVFTAPRGVQEVSAEIHHVTIRADGSYSVMVHIVQADGSRRAVEATGQLTPARRRALRDALITDLVSAGVLPAGSDS